MLGALGLASAIALAVVFAVAGTAKLSNRVLTGTTLRAFGLPDAAVAPMAVLLPIAELGVAALLVVDRVRAVGAVFGLALLVVFSAAVSVSLARGRAPACHCFGQMHAAPVGRWTLARNAALAGLGLLVLAAGDAPVSASGLLVVAASLAVAAGLGGATALVVALMRSHGRLLLRLDRLEQDLVAAGIAFEDPERAGVRPGTAAPAFSLAGTGASSLDALLEPGLPLLLVFTDPGCEPCRELLPRLAAWQRAHAGRLEIAVLTAGTVDVARAEAREHGLRTVLADPDAAVLGRYAMGATPGAVVVDPDGTLAGWAVSGGDEIAGLVAATVAAEDARVQLRPGEPAPALALTGLDGEDVSLIDPEGGPTLVVFWNPGCGFCSSMREELLVAARDAPRGAPRLLVLSSGDAEATRADGFVGAVALDAEMAAGGRFGATGTPMAVLVDGAGRVASELAAGATAVLALAGPPRLHVEQVG